MSFSYIDYLSPLIPRHTLRDSTPFFWRQFLIGVSCRYGTGFLLTDSDAD